MTGEQRVLDALMRAGRAGVTQADFLLPRVIDGGKPYQRVAARINDLRKQGYEISTRRLKNGTACYQLMTEREPASTVREPANSSPRPATAEGVVGPSASSLFDVPVGRLNACLHDYEDAA